MHILEVIPLSVLPPQVPQVLSYFSDDDLPKGAVVEVPLHNRKIPAIIIGSTSMDKQRILVKKSAFQLKKISAVLSNKAEVSEYQFKLALWMANEYLSPLGLALKATLPPFFLKKKYPTPTKSFTEHDLVSQPAIILARAKEVPALTATRLRPGGQSLILVPEMSYLSRFKKEVPRAEILHSALKNSEYYALWQQVGTTQDLTVIGTRQALFLPYTNLRDIIVIDPHHEFYKSDMSPKYKTPALAEYVAQIYGARLTLISNFLGVQAYTRIEKKELPLKDTMKHWPMIPEVIDLISEMKQGYVGALSVPLKKAVSEAVKNGKKVLIYAARRGYAGIMVCKRCNLTVNCPRCQNPMKVHVALERILICHHCATNQPYPKFCANCHSSEIKPTGPAGSQKIYEELQKMMEFGQLNRVPTLILDADVTQNQIEEDEIMETVRKAGAKILIATAKIFSYIYDDRFDLIAIPQFDALSTSPDYQTTERLWYQLEKLADFEPRQMFIQTYDASRIPQHVFAHDYTETYEEETTIRSLMTFPPFARIVKLTFSHRSPQTAVKAGRLLIEKLKMAAIHMRADKLVRISDSSPMFLSKEKDLYYTFTVILKILPGLASFRELVKYAPSGWLIDVDPRQIL